MFRPLADWLNAGGRGFGNRRLPMLMTGSAGAAALLTGLGTGDLDLALTLAVLTGALVGLLCLASMASRSSHGR